MSWNYGDVLDSVGQAIEPSKPALIHGDITRSWSDFDRRTNALARAFLAAGALPGDKVAHLMRNSPAYLEVTGACFKASMVHVNVNYRYTGEELFYIFENSDAAVIVYDSSFKMDIEALKPRLSAVKLFVDVGADYEEIAHGNNAPPNSDRSDDDMLFIYTGGTTGMPKGVMWATRDLWKIMGGGATSYLGAPVESLAAHQDNIRAGLVGNRLLVCPPLMHGSGYMMATYTLCCGGSVVTLPGASFDPVAALQAIEDHAPSWMVIVGDAFARPLLRALDAEPGRFDLSALKIIISSGTMWSPEVKAGLLRHNPDMMLLDALGSSEGLGLGVAPMTAQNAGAATRFIRDAKTRVINDAGRDVVPGSGEIGMIARAGILPRGYYKDPEKTARLFREIDGVRYSLPGDFASVEADGTITLLGRGNQCINTAGEKVFPEEVEEALKTHTCVEDALVFGVPDEKWGSAVTALVELNTPAELEALRAHVRTVLAGYKTPKAIYITGKMPRAPNGKADYAAAKAFVAGLK
jgi:3-oxocholest-4-en-26-oate---CoA ligase